MPRSVALWTRDVSPGALEKLLEIEPGAGLDHTAGEPAVGNAEFSLGVGLYIRIDDDRMTQDVVGLPRPYRDRTQRHGNIGATLRAGEYFRQCAGALAPVAGNVPHRAGARGIRRAAVAAFVNVDAVRTGEELIEVAGHGNFVAALSERDQAADIAAVLRHESSDAHRALRGRLFPGRASAAPRGEQRQGCQRY